MGTMTSQIAQDLQDTRTVLDMHGWCQGSYALPDGRVCLDGALIQAIGRAPGHTTMVRDELHGRYSAAIGHLSITIELNYPDETGHVWDFNDSPETTVEDVKELLQLAIDSA
jgi:hypothetical protein